jgi:copper transport protein
MWSRLILAVVAVAAALAGGWASIGTAWSHAVLVDAWPPDGAVVDRAPGEIVLRYDEPVAPIVVRVVGAAGAVASPALPRAAGPEVRLALPGDLAPGGYLVSWRVISADGHPIAGALAFSIGAGAAPPPSEPEAQSEPGWRWAKIVLRFLADAALVIAAGGMLFGVLVLRRGVLATEIARLTRPAAMAAAILAGATVGAQGGLMRSESLATLFEATTWHFGWSTSVGASTAMMVAGLAVASLGDAVRIRWITGVGAVVATTSLALGGHSAASGWMVQTVLALHVTCAAYWLGSLWPLLIVLGRLPANEAASVVRRFSAFAVAAVALLAVCGLVIAASRVSDIGAAVATGYGRLLIVKLTLVGVLISVAAINRQRLTPLWAAGTSASALRRNIRIEIALGAAILTATAVLAHTPPPAAEMHVGHTADHDGHGAAQAEKSAAVESRGRLALITLTPGRAGANAVDVDLRTPSGDPFAAREVTVVTSSPALGVEGLARAAEKTAEGRYALRRIDLPLAGRWTVRIDALVTDFEKEVFEAVVDVD